MTVGVVDALEVVHVDEDDGEGFSGAAGESERLLGEDEEATAIEEAGEFVAEREVADFLFQAIDAAAEGEDETEGEQGGGGRCKGVGVLGLEDVGADDGVSAGREEQGQDQGAGRGEAGDFPADSVADEDVEDAEFGAAIECGEAEQDEAGEGLRGEVLEHPTSKESQCSDDVGRDEDEHDHAKDEREGVDEVGEEVLAGAHSQGENCDEQEGVCDLRSWPVTMDGSGMGCEEGINPGRTVEQTLHNRDD